MANINAILFGNSVSKGFLSNMETANTGILMKELFNVVVMLPLLQFGMNSVCVSKFQFHGGSICIFFWK